MIRNNPKDLDPSYKMKIDLDFLRLFGKEKHLHLIEEEIRYYLQNLYRYCLIEVKVAM